MLFVVECGVIVIISMFFKIAAGVPQGSGFGPSLFMSKNNVTQELAHEEEKKKGK